MAGWTIANDLTARDFVGRDDLGPVGADWLQSKCAPTYKPIGPYVVPAAFVEDPQDLRIQLRLNGELMQDETTADMIFDVASLIAFASRQAQLLPGDVVLTGSPAGNGQPLRPLAAPRRRDGGLHHRPRHAAQPRGVGMTIRADHIGSLQRPEALLAEIHRVYEAGHTSLLADERAKDLTRLRALEDEAIRRVVTRQEEVGLEVVTDGEFRRLMYFNSFFDAVDGLSPSQGKLQFRGDDGSVVEHEGAATITGRVAKIDSPAAREAAFVGELTERTVKVSFPTASFLVGNAALGPGLAAYDSPEEASRQPRRGAAQPGRRRRRRRRHLRAVRRLRLHDAVGVAARAARPLARASISTRSSIACWRPTDAIVAGLPAHVTTCLHQCRGNYASRYLTPHDHLGELGETFFSLPYDRFTLEWDGHVERTDADYAALERVPRGGATVVLGVVSTRHDQVESADDILATVERAARHIPVEQLAISPQCGFASALTTGDDDRPDGNLIDEDAQWRKLELLVTTARRIWT